jgi:hypothetical protein
METFVPLLAAVALIYGLTNLIKVALAGQGKVVITQLASWLVAIAVVFLLAASDFADSITVGSGEAAWALGSLNAWSLVLVGVSLAGAANAVYDVIPKDTPTIGVTPPPYEG